MNFRCRSKYSSVARTLCQNNEINQTYEHPSKIFVEVSTLNNDPIKYTISVHEVNGLIIE